MPPRVDMTNSVCNCGRDSTRPPGPATDRRTGTRILTRVVRPTPRRMRDAHLNRRARGRRADRSSRRRGSRASWGSAVGRVELERRGKASAAGPGSATGSNSLLCGGLGRRSDVRYGVDQAPRRNGRPRRAERVDFGGGLYGVVRAYAAILGINPAAGAGALAGSEHVIGHMRFGLEWLRAENLVADCCRLVRRRDESLQPTLPDRRRS